MVFILNSLGSLKPDNLECLKTKKMVLGMYCYMYISK